MPLPSSRPTITLRSLRGGRNGGDPPIALSDVQCVTCFNIEWYRATVARKRKGSDSISLTGGTTFTGKISSLFRHVPAASEPAAELWAIDDAATPLVKRLTGGTSWADVSLNDAISGSAQEVNAVTFNGKLYLAYDSSVDRLHLWDPDTSDVRRAGIAKSATPGAPSEAAGLVTDTRQYKVAFTQQSGGVTIRRGELSDATATVTLIAEKATVTKPSNPGEDETHWELYAASTTDGFFRLIATNAIATTTQEDNNASLAAFTTFEPLIGTYTVLPSMRFLSTDGNRILGCGAWETGQPSSRVWLTPVLGDLDISDGERYYNTVEIKGYVDLNEKDGGGCTGISLPLYGSIYVFKYRQIWKLVPTDDEVKPYLPVRISASVGCVAHKTIRSGVDENGNDCIYFLSHVGPCRIGMDGVITMVDDVQDIWESVNLDATTVVSHATWYDEKKQYWLWLATGSSNVPDTLWVFNSKFATTTPQGVRGGWSVYTGDLANCRASCQFSQSIGASMSRKLKPFAARESTNLLFRADSSSVNTDNGTTFRAYFTSKPYSMGGDGQKFTVHYPQVTATVSTGNSLLVTAIRDYGLESQASDSVSLTAIASETRVMALAEKAMLAGCRTAQFEIGDSAAVDSAWSIDLVVFPYVVDGEAGAQR